MKLLLKFALTALALDIAIYTEYLLIEHVDRFYSLQFFQSILAIGAWAWIAVAAIAVIWGVLKVGMEKH